MSAAKKAAHLAGQQKRAENADAGTAQEEVTSLLRESVELLTAIQSLQAEQVDVLRRIKSLMP